MITQAEFSQCFKNFFPLLLRGQEKAILSLILGIEGLKFAFLCLSLTHSLCWFLDIKFKEYSRSILAPKTEYLRSVQSSSIQNFTQHATAQVLQNLSPILKSLLNP